MKRDVLAAARRRRAAAPQNTTDWHLEALCIEPEGCDPSSGIKFGLERGFTLEGVNLHDKLISHARSSLSPKCTPRMSGFLESQRLRCPRPGLLGERLELPRRLKSSYIRFLFGPWRGRFSCLIGKGYGGCYSMRFHTPLAPVGYL